MTSAPFLKNAAIAGKRFWIRLQEDEYTRTIEPARALAAEALILQRTLNTLLNQAYRYAIKLPCDWIIVNSVRDTRLYYKGPHQQTYERFETVRLAADEALLKRFVFLLMPAR